MHVNEFFTRAERKYFMARKNRNIKSEQNQVPIGFL